MYVGVSTRSDCRKASQSEVSWGLQVLEWLDVGGLACMVQQATTGAMKILTEPYCNSRNRSRNNNKDKYEDAASKTTVLLLPVTVITLWP